MNLDFVEKAIYEKGFKEYYDKNLRDVFESFEVLRISKLRYLILTTFLLSAIFFGIITFCNNHFADFSISKVIADISPPKHEHRAIYSYVIYADIFASAFIILSIISSYKKHLKDEVLPIIFKFYGDWKYENHNKISDDILTKSKLYGDRFNFTAENYITGSYRNINIEIAEASINVLANKNLLSESVEIFDLLASKKVPKDQVLEYFKGIIVSVDFNKNFKGETLLYRKSWLSEKYKNFKSINSMQVIELEDVQFNKLYHVMSDDQIEARYILTTAFMERLIKVSDDFCEYRRIECSFFDNKLFLSIPCVNELFDPGSIFKKISTDDLHIILAHINMIFNIVDELKLYQRIGM